MKDKKIIFGIIIVVIIIVILLGKNLIRSNEKPDISVHIDSIEEIKAQDAMDVFNEDGEKDYVKVKLSIKNNSKNKVEYSTSKIIKASQEEISEEFLPPIESSDNMKAYASIEPKETMSGYLYFETSYEKNMKLKTIIMCNARKNGDTISADENEYIIDLKK